MQSIATRFSAVLLLALFVPSVSAQTRVGQGRIRWYSNLDQAREAARKTNQLILLHFELDNCPPCRQVERNVFPRPQVAQAIAAGFIPVKLNYKNAKQLANQLKVDRFPTDVILTPSGKIVKKGGSPLDAQSYTRMLTKVSSNYYGPEQARRNRIAKTTPRSNYVDGSQRQNRRPGNSNETRRGFEDRSNSDNRYANNSRGFGNGNGNTNSNRTANRGSHFKPNGRNYARGGRFDPNRSSIDTVTPPRRGSGFRDEAYGRQNSTGRSNSNQRNPQFDPRRNRISERQPFFDRNQNQRRTSAPDQNQFSGAQRRNGSAGSFDRTSRENGSQNRQSTRDSQLVRNPYLNRRTSQTGFSRETANEGLNPICFDGYCPVTLATRKLWRRGLPTQSMVYQGRTYYFATPEARRTFAQQPSRFSPFFSGYDPVLYLETGQRVLGKRRHGLFVDKNVYLFRDEASLLRFKQSPDRYNRGIQQALQRSSNPRRSR